MVKVEHEKFCIGNKVFVKIKGFPHWPAVVTGIENDEKKKLLKYNVKYFGTQEVGQVNKDHICLYSENKEKYGIKKTDNYKNKSFNYALMEAESSLVPELNKAPSRKKLKNSDLSIEEALEKIKKHENEEDDLETSLSLAAEVGSSLLTANSELNQEIEKLKNDNSNLVSTILSLQRENREIITESEEELRNREEQVKILVERNNNFEEEIDFLKRKFESEVLLKEELIKMEEKGKSLYQNQINNLNAIKSTQSKRILELEQTIKKLKLDSKRNIHVGVNMEACLSLLGNKWIMDDSITLYFDCLEEKKIKQTCFIKPAIVQAIKCLEDTNTIIEPLELKDKNYIFIPINNAEKDEEGSHWSLLFYNKSEKTCYYLDSNKQSNIKHARIVFSKIKNYLCTSDNNHINLRIVDCPQQDNGYDCGIYLLLFVDWLISTIVVKSQSESIFILNSTKNYNITTQDTIRKRALLAYITYQQKNLVKEVIKSLITCDSSKQSEVSKEGHCGIATIHLEDENLMNNHENQSKSKVLSKKDTNSWSLVKRNKSENKTLKYTNQVKDGNKNSAIPTNNKYDILNNHEQEQALSPEDNSRPTLTYYNTRIKAKKYPQKLMKNKNCYPKVQVSLSSDSQGRYVRDKMEQLSFEQISAFGYVRPNTTLIQIADLALLEDDKRPLILLGGTNDSIKNNLKEVYEKLEVKLNILSKKRQVYVTTIPTRFDQPIDGPINDDLKMLNNYIKELVYRLKNVFLIELTNLRRFHFTKHGLHLNKIGKSQLAQTIIDAIAEQCHKKESVHYSSQNKSLSTVKIKTLPINKSLNGNNTCMNSKNEQKKHLMGSECTKKAAIEPTIRTIEADMAEIITKYCKNKHTAFAHCISADFGSDKQMSAGVAVTFKNKFGKPSVSDCVNKYLAYQNTEYGAGVYSLITKPKYDKKPNIPSYDAAFEEFTEDFKAKGYKHLVCSPMGCVRDLIEVQHFIKNLLKFQSETGANITIVSCKERSRRTLRNGLSYEDFITEIWKNIVLESENVKSRNGHLQLARGTYGGGVQPLTPMDAFPPLIRDDVGVDKSLDISLLSKGANPFL